MARHNIIMGNDRAFTGGDAGFDSSGRVADRPQYGYGQQSPYGQQAPASPEELQAMYARPAATGHDTGRMTMRDALNAITATLGVIIVVALAVGTLPAVLGAVSGEQGFQLGMGVSLIATVIGLIGGLVLGLVNAFKRTPSPALVLLYAVFEGMVLGGISGMLEAQFDGIVLQAVGATLAVAGTVLVMFRVGVLRTSPRLTKIFMVAMAAYLLFSLVSLGFAFVTGEGLRSGPMGLIVGAIAVLLASYSLVMDFEDVQRGVTNGIPRVFAWRCAFGIAMTLVWMYLEILRILSILRSN